MANFLIDLGEVPKHRDRPAATAVDAFPYRAVLGTLSVVLVVLLAGGVHRPPPSPPAVIAARLGDATFVVGNRLLLVSAGPERLGSNLQNKIISTYALPGAKLLSRTTVAVSGSISNVALAGDTLVVTYQVDTSGSQATVALTAGTDQTRWRRPQGLQGISGADGLALLTSFSYGNSYLSGDGLGLARWYGVDLATGQDRWTLQQPADGYTIPAGERDGMPRWFVTLTAAGRLETRDAVTGAVTAEVSVPTFDLKANTPFWTVGDLVLVGTRTAGLTAYRLPDLTPRWHSDVDLSQSWTATACGPVICAFRSQHGMSALDPATGRKLWESDQWANVEPSGRYLVATRNDQSADAAPLTVLDPRTGATHGDFGPWQGLATVGASDLTYAMRVVYGRYVIWYGVLDPDRLDVRILGSADRVSNDCQVSAGALICRLVDASVAVRPLR